MAGPYSSAAEIAPELLADFLALLPSGWTVIGSLQSSGTVRLELAHSCEDLCGLPVQAVIENTPTSRSLKLVRFL